MIHCKNLCKCYNVPPSSTTIKKKKIKKEVELKFPFLKVSERHPGKTIMDTIYYHLSVPVTMLSVSYRGNYFIYFPQSIYEVECIIVSMFYRQEDTEKFSMFPRAFCL
jgi:hypothetical protein